MQQNYQELFGNCKTSVPQNSEQPPVDCQHLLGRSLFFRAPTLAKEKRVALRLVTCGGLAIRLVLIPELFTGRLTIGRRLPTSPH